MLSEGVVRPIGLEHVRKAAAGQKKLTTVEVLAHTGEKVKQTTVATEADILVMIKAWRAWGIKTSSS